MASLLTGLLGNALKCHYDRVSLHSMMEANIIVTGAIESEGNTYWQQGQFFLTPIARRYWHPHLATRSCKVPSTEICPFLAPFPCFHGLKRESVRQAQRIAKEQKLVCAVNTSVTSRSVGRLYVPLSCCDANPKTSCALSGH